MTHPLITELEALEAKATPGEWTHRTNPHDPAGFIEAKIAGKPYGQEVMGDDYFPELDKHADAALIVAMRNALPKLLAALRHEMETSDYLILISSRDIKEKQLAMRRAELALILGGGK